MNQSTWHKQVSSTIKKRVDSAEFGSLQYAVTLFGSKILPKVIPLGCS